MLFRSTFLRRPGLRAAFGSPAAAAAAEEKRRWPEMVRREREVLVEEKRERRMGPTITISLWFGLQRENGEDDDDLLGVSWFRFW